MSFEAIEVIQRLLRSFEAFKTFQNSNETFFGHFQTLC